jgi:hypothetical protein
MEAQYQRAGRLLRRNSCMMGKFEIYQPRDRRMDDIHLLGTVSANHSRAGEDRYRSRRLSSRRVVNFWALDQKPVAPKTE